MSVPAESIFFDLWSASYDRPGLQQTTYRPIHDAVLERLEGLSPDRILDLGCGTGQLTQRLHTTFPAAGVVGIDLSDGMLEKAAERLDADDRGGTTGFVRANAQCLPLAPGTLDVITCTESFHWYDDQEAAVVELSRLLRPGGRLIIASIATVTGFADEAIQKATAAAGRQVRAIPKRKLRRLLEAGDFDVTYQGRIPRLGFVPWPILTDATKR
ncbi:MAG: ubiquinone/menaquinone biosynthesis C-methylase UbiE [Candidatus Aldehydirespiratoraceae bacterium]|jgi:ubiquinone/menaquinone biosynthesis C-methylase UbiE